MIFTVNFFNTGSLSAEDIQALEKSITATLDSMAFHRDGTVNLRITDIPEIRSYNRQYFGRDRETDVICFPFHEEDSEEGCFILGDVLICDEVARKEARSRNVSVTSELCLYAVHGTLHLIGYEDDTEEKRAEMFRLQEKILSKAQLYDH